MDRGVCLKETVQENADLVRDGCISGVVRVNRSSMIGIGGGDRWGEGRKI